MASKDAERLSALHEAHRIGYQGAVDHMKLMAQAFLDGDVEIFKKEELVAETREAALREAAAVCQDYLDNPNATPAGGAALWFREQILALIPSSSETGGTDAKL